jgi:tetratricopeptide (TPR) repeat protein
MPLRDDEKDSFRYELARVLSSSTFAKAAKQRDLLRWLGEYVLSDGGAPLSQYAIATQALSYPPSFDPAGGAVRIALRRLRQKLADYYANEGRLNRFHIAIEKEQYEPRLLPGRDTVPSALAIPAKSLASKLAVLVLPFLPVGFRDDDWFCAGLTLGLMRSLAASGQARVVPWTTSHWIAERTGDKREYHRATGADVILEGLVQPISGNRIKVGVHWIDGITGLFDTFHEVTGGAGDSLAIVSDLAIKLSGRLQVTYDERTRMQVAMRESSDPAAAAFYLKARDAALTLTPPGIGKALSLVGYALERDPYFAAAHALAADVNLSVGDAGMASANQHAPLARAAAERALSLAPEMGDGFGARGALELVYDWDFPQAEETLSFAQVDPLAEQVPHWPPILKIARGMMAEAAVDFDKWARLDPGCSGKAEIACEFWYYARQYDDAIRWGLRALDRDPHDSRAGMLLADCYLNAGQREEGLRIANTTYDLAPDFAETNLAMVYVLAKAGLRADARRTLKSWEHRQPDQYVYPIMRAIAYGWLGEHSLALDAMRDTIAARHTVCLFARCAPYLEPLQGLTEFDRMLTEAGLP